MEDYKNKDWLIDQYLNKKRSCDEIAIEQKRDPKTIWSWVVKFGIPTRKRGAESSGGTFEKGHKKGVGRIHTQETKDKIREARIKDGHVPYLKNGIHWLHQEGAVSPNFKGGITPDRQAVYSSLEWKDCIKKVWKRDNASCRVCGIHQSSIRDKKFHIHHIESFAVKEKRTDVNNLVLVCQKCHHFLHSKRNKNKQFIK
jgi:hypothetical protein